MDQYQRDECYRELLLEPLRKCATYRPKFGSALRSGTGVESELDLEGFQRLYGGDPLYSWIGMDSPLMYAAHKAAGGMTSIYRQLGIGCERLIRKVASDSLGLENEAMAWAYNSVDDNGKSKTLTLDAKVGVDDILDKASRDRFKR